MIKLFKYLYWEWREKQYSHCTAVYRACVQIFIPLLILCIPVFFLSREFARDIHNDVLDSIITTSGIIVVIIFAYGVYKYILKCKNDRLNLTILKTNKVFFFKGTAPCNNCQNGNGYMTKPIFRTLILAIIIVLPMLGTYHFLTNICFSSALYEFIAAFTTVWMVLVIVLMFSKKHFVKFLKNAKLVKCFYFEYYLLALTATMILLLTVILILVVRDIY